MAGHQAPCRHSASLLLRVLEPVWLSHSRLGDDTLFAGQRTRGAQRGLRGHFFLALRMLTVLKFQQEAKHLLFK